MRENTKIKNDQKQNVCYSKNSMRNSPLMVAVNIKTAIKKLEAERLTNNK